MVMTGVLAAWILLDAGEVREASWDALVLCARSVVPALFPFLTVSGAAMAMGIGDLAAPLCSGLMVPLFRLPGQAGSALILGLLGGYPAGARATAELYRQRSLSRDEAQRLLAFSNCAGPAFLIGVLGSGTFGSVRAGLWLELLHLLSALLTGLLFRGRGDVRETVPPVPPDPPPPLLSAVTGAVGDASLTMVRICGCVVFFSVLSAPLRRIGGWPGTLAVGLLDLFSLTPLLPPDRLGFLAASALTGLGGACVLCQTAAAVEGSGLSMRSYAAGKAVQGLIAGALAAVLTAVSWPL